MSKLSSDPRGEFDAPTAPPEGLRLSKIPSVSFERISLIGSLPPPKKDFVPPAELCDERTGLRMLALAGVAAPKLGRIGFSGILSFLGDPPPVKRLSEVNCGLV